MGRFADDWAMRIQVVHQKLPQGATLAERIKAVDAAAPCDMRGFSPYKSWLRARRRYLVPYGYKPRTKADPSTLI